jgi:chromosome segregation ATPase
VEQAVNRMQYYQHSRQTQSSKPERDVRQVGPADAPQPKEWRELKKQMSELVKELKDRDELIKQMSEQMKELRDQAELTKQIRELVGELKDRASLPRRSETLLGKRKPTGCFECDDPGHFKRECSLLQGKPDPSREQNPWIRKVSGGE